MNPPFLTLPPSKRYKRMRRLLHIFHNNALIVNAQFSILVYGSASYGYNKQRHGSLDDIDLFLIVPRFVGVNDFLSQVQSVFLVKPEVKIAHLRSVFEGQYGICRMYCQVDGVRVGFRIICLDMFCKFCSEEGASEPVLNIASLGQSRILSDKEWSFKLRRYVKLIFDHRYVVLDGEQLLVVTQYVFSKRLIRLGPLGRKLLMAKVVFSGQLDLIQESLTTLLKVFVKRSRFFTPSITSDEMIDSIIRSERFSLAFRHDFRRRVDLLH